MSAEENQATVRSLITSVLNQGRSLDAYLTSDFVLHAPGRRAPVDGERCKQIFVRFVASFPDFSASFSRILAEEDAVAVRLTCRGTHLAEFWGIAPSQRPVAFTATTICHLRNGKLAEVWLDADLLGLLEQIGALPGLAELLRGAEWSDGRWWSNI